jgi:PAS domain S-box-containing protein
MTKPKIDKKAGSPSKEELLTELAELKERLREAEETLDAIRTGAVDAVVVSGKEGGEQIYTLQGADQPYRQLVESINEGTVTMSTDGTILYSNRQFAAMLGYPLEKVIGASFLDFVSKQDRPPVAEIFHRGTNEAVRLQALLCSYEWGKIPVQIAFSAGGVRGAGSMTAIVADLSDQLRYQQIVQQEKLSRAIMKNSPNGIAVCDPEGRIIRMSGALQAFCCKSPLMETFDQIFHIEISAENQPAPLFSAAAVLQGKRLPETEARLSCNGKEIRDVSITAVPLRDDEGGVAGCLIELADITARKRSEETLLRHSEKLAAANKELDSFAYSVSHDLRAPLRAIEGFTRMLTVKMGDRLNDEEKRRFEVIRENTQKMGRLIDDLLDFSRLGRQSMRLSTVDMAGMARQTWEELVAANPGRRMEFALENLPAALADLTLIKQVFVNLLSNAVKFTRKKEIARISIGSSSENSETVYFIRDNGTGFDMRFHEKLFGVFQRLHSAEEFEGIGAGLAIVRRIIHRHGGRTWAEGEVDRGATFYFSLPSKPL